MTLIAGVIYKNTAALIADSAVTGIVALPAQANLAHPKIASILGDTPFYDGTNLVTESCQKIYCLNESMLITYAGSEIEGTSTISHIRGLLKSFPRFSDLLMKYFQSNNFQQTQYIAAFHEEGTAKLFIKYPNDTPRVIDQSLAIAMAGANAKDIYESIQKNCQNSDSKNFSPQQNLQLILGALQGLAVHLNTLEDGVGGLFNGAMATKKGIEWAKDTFFMLYSAKAYERGDKYYAFRYNRHNAIFAANRNKKVLFYPDIDGVPSDEKIHEWSEEINPLIESLHADFFVLISYDQKNVVVVDNDVCKEERIEITNGQFKIDGLIKNYMFQYHSRTPGGPQTGFELNTNFLSPLRSPK